MPPIMHPQVRLHTDTQVFRSPNREAPAFFSHDGSFYLWTSGTLGWTPVQAYIYRGPTALGPFNQSLGHGWHAYIKNPGFNQSREWTVRDGYLPSGHDWIPPRNITFSAAQSLCSNSPQCFGFTFRAEDRRPPENTILKCSFKNSSVFVPEGDPDGLQPPPIPEPGDPGNRKEDGQPGIFSFGSQSTYILPNPAYRRSGPNARLAQFIYMADRWAPSTSTFGTYVWLPLFIDPANGSRVRVVWHNAWTLENATSPFV